MEEGAPCHQPQPRGRARLTADDEHAAAGPHLGECLPGRRRDVT